VLSCCFYCLRITLRLAVLRPTGFPKRRGVRVMPLFVFVFDCAQRLHGCCPALALSAGHGPRKRACKPLGGFHCCSNTATDGGRLPYDSILVGSGKVGSGKVGSVKVGFGKVGSHKDGFAKVGSAKVGSAKVGSAQVGSTKVSFTCGVCRQ